MIPQGSMISQEEISFHIKMHENNNINLMCSQVEELNIIRCIYCLSSSKGSQSLSSVWLCNPIDCSPPGSSGYGIFQARILELVAISFSRGSSQPRDHTHVSGVSWIAGTFFTTGPPGEFHYFVYHKQLWISEAKSASSYAFQVLHLCWIFVSFSIIYSES